MSDQHHPCAKYLETVRIPDLKVKQCRPRLPEKYKCRTSTINFPPDPCYEEKVYHYPCVPPPPPTPPPPPDLCKALRIKHAIKKGVNICPKPPVEIPELPAPPTGCKVFICDEKIKNFPVKVQKESGSRPRCVPERVLTTNERCLEMLRQQASPDPTPWPCPVEPPRIPPPQLRSPCDIIQEREKKELCHLRMKQYSSDLPENRASPNAVPRKKKLPE